MKNFPDARHFVIGHSHGGNVILRALDGFSKVGDLEGVVTLATPFIDWEGRDLDRLFRKLRIGSVLLWTLPALIVNWVIIGRFTGPWITGVLWQDLVIWAIGAAFLWFVAFRQNGALHSRAKSKQKEILDSFDQAGKVDCPFFSVAVKNDEAGIGLRAGSKLAGLGTGIAFVIKILNVFYWIGVIALMYYLRDEIRSTLYFGDNHFDYYNFYAILLILGAGQLFISILHSIFSGFGLGFRGVVHSAVFGSGGLIKNALIKITTSKQPNGVKDHTFLEYKDLDKGSSSLRHSLVYETQEIIDDVSEWIVGPKSENGMES